MRSLNICRTIILDEPCTSEEHNPVQDRENHPQDHAADAIIEQNEIRQPKHHSNRGQP